MVKERGVSNRKPNNGATRYDNQFGAPVYQTSGSAAYKVQPDDQRAPARKKRVQPKQKKKVSAFAKAMLVILVMFVFGMGCVVITRQNTIVKNGKEIATLKEQIRLEEKRTEDLKLALASATDINTIMQEASARLGMGYPDEGQIRAFAMPQPKANVLQSAQQQATPQEKSLGFLGTFLGLFR